jgi:SMI1 / KNR4 family (SUKH-1)
MNDWMKQIIDQWTDEAICFNLGASLEQINNAERKMEFSFPEAFKRFYLQVNGFKQGEWISNLFSIWSLEKILEEYHDCNDKNFVGFADYLINSHQIGFVKGHEGIFKYYDAPEKIAETFELGLMLINQDSELLY